MPVRVVEQLDDAILALKAERDENECREPIPMDELLELGKKLEALEKPLAKKRQAKAGPKTGLGKKLTGEGNLHSPVKGKTDEKVAKALGVSGGTYKRAKKVPKATEENPQSFGDLKKKMET